MPVRVLGPRLRRIVNDVDPLVGRVELIGRRAHLRITPEECVAGCAGVAEVAAVARGIGRRTLHGLFLAGRIVADKLGRDRLRRCLVLRVVGDERRQEPRRAKGLAAVG